MLPTLSLVGSGRAYRFSDVVSCSISSTVRMTVAFDENARCVTIMSVSSSAISTVLYCSAKPEISPAGPLPASNRNMFPLFAEISKAWLSIAVNPSGLGTEASGIR